METRTIANRENHTVSRIEQFEGLRPNFDAYSLEVYGHTYLLTSDRDGNGTLQQDSICFDSFEAVQDIGVELLRASHIEIPEGAIVFLEENTDKIYEDERYIENPLNTTFVENIVSL